MEDNDEYEMEELGMKYPEYDDMDYAQLHDEYNNLIDQWDPLIGELNDNPRVKYVKHLMELTEKDIESSFNDNDNGKTITITNRNKTAVSVPRVDFVEQPLEQTTNYVNVSNDSFNLAFEKEEEIERRLKDLNDFNRKITEKEIERVKIINKKIQKLKGKKLGTDKASREIVNRTKVDDKTGSVYFKRMKGDGTYGEPVIILKKGMSGGLVYSINRNEGHRIARRQFRAFVEKIPEGSQDAPRGETSSQYVEKIEMNEFPLINTNVEQPDIDGLTPKENREFNCVLNPPDTIDPQSRIGDNGALQIQADNFEDAFNKTYDERDNTEDPEEFIELQERIIGLREARDRTLEQKQLEEAREQQEEDINRLERFKEWAKENMVGLSAVTISIAGIVTSIIVGTRKAIIKGAQATGKFAKAVYELGKKLGALLAPLFTIISYALSAGAKGIAWLASNLWVLAIAVAWFIYDNYKRRK